MATSISHVRQAPRVLPFPYALNPLDCIFLDKVLLYIEA